MCPKQIDSWIGLLLVSSLMWSHMLIAEPFAYVANGGSNTISVFDTATNTIVGNPILVGQAPEHIAITPDRTRVYVTNNHDNTVSVINTATNSVIGSPILVGEQPVGIAITPDGAKAYVCNTLTNFISVIDTNTNSVLKTITVGTAPFSVAILPNGTKAYVTNFGNQTVSVIDVATDMVVGSPIPVGNMPNVIVITPDGSKAYICNQNDHTVSVINTATDSLISSPIDIGINPQDMAMTPDGTKAYICSRTGEIIVIINTLTDTLENPITFAESCAAIALTPDGSKAYVCDMNNDVVRTIDLPTNIITTTSISVGESPFAIAITPPLVPVEPPQNCIGKIVRYSQAHWKKTLLTMQWEKSSSLNIDHYEIFAFGALIASIPASGPLQFQKRLQPYVRENRLSNKYFQYLGEKYRIRAVSSTGVVSAFMHITIAKCTIINKEL